MHTTLHLILMFPKVLVKDIGHFQKQTERSYLHSVSVQNLLMFTFRGNSPHICKCVPTENKLWHWWCVLILKPNTQRGNESVRLTLGLEPVLNHNDNSWGWRGEKKTHNVIWSYFIPRKVKILRCIRAGTQDLEELWMWLNVDECSSVKKKKKTALFTHHSVNLVIFMAKIPKIITDSWQQITDRLNKPTVESKFLNLFNLRSNQTKFT